MLFPSSLTPPMPKSYTRMLLSCLYCSSCSFSCSSKGWCFWRLAFHGKLLPIQKFLILANVCMSGHQPLAYVEESPLSGSILWVSKAMEWSPCTMMVPSSIPTTSSLSARCGVRVGNDHIGRISPPPWAYPRPSRLYHDLPMFPLLLDLWVVQHVVIHFSPTPDQVASQVECH